MRSLGIVCVVVLAGAVSCKGGTGNRAAPGTMGTAGTAGAGGTSSDPCAAGATPETAKIFDGLRPACEGCHLTGVRAFFASLKAFQSLLVADPRLVVPGDPEQSELMRLLRGTGSGAFKQMPIAGPTYEALAASGAQPLTMDEISTWIAGLTVQQRDARPDPESPRVARMSATQIQRALYQQLGLTHDDFFESSSEFGVPMASAKNGDELYPLQGPDALPTPANRPTLERHVALGGGSALMQVQAQLETGPTFVHSLTPLAQRWCRLALEKPMNTALFPGGASMSADAAEAKATLARWHFHFLAERPSDAEVDAVYNGVFVPLATGGVDVAYVGVCSYFIRHPQWVFY
jgi:hypothetical protein